jgi:hypothetical protein
MKTELMPLNVKEIFDKKKVDYSKFDVARMRYLCKQFVEYIIEHEKSKTEGKGNIFMEEGKAGTEAVGAR